MLQPMNDLLYYEPIAQLLESDPTWLAASTQVRFGYLSLMASFHWNLCKFIGVVGPTYRLAPTSIHPHPTDLALPYLNGKLSLYVHIDGLPSDDWPLNATVVHLANVHADAMPSMLCTKSADIAATLLSNIGHMVVIRVVLEALRRSRRRTVDPGVLEEAISTLCLLSHRRYEGRTPELAVCFGPSLGHGPRDQDPVYFGRQFLTSKKTAVLLKGASYVIRCLRNGRVIDFVDLNSQNRTRPPPIIAPPDQFATLAYSFSQGGLTTVLTPNGEVLIAIGVRTLFVWNASNWRLYPAHTLEARLMSELCVIWPTAKKALRKSIAGHCIISALSLRDDHFGALLVLAKDEDAVSMLTKSRQHKQSSIELLYSNLFVGRKLLAIAPRLLRNAAALDGAIVIDPTGIVRAIGCIFTTTGVKTKTEGARTKAALFASQMGVALKISQDGEITIYSASEATSTAFAPTS